MATSAFSSAGTTVAVSASLPAADTATGFGALTYTDIGEIVNTGDFGAQYETVTHVPLADRIVYKFKGSVNYGSLDLQMGRVPSDAGQTILVAALASDNDYSFEVTLQDGTLIYFKGKVMSYTTNVGNNSAITGSTCTIELTSATVEV